MTTMPVRVPTQHELEQIWEDRVRRWRKSGLTATEFASKEGVTAGRLYAWNSRLRRLGRAIDEPTGSSSMLLPVVVRDGEPSPRDGGAPIEIVVRGELVLRVRGDFDAVLLRRVVAALEGTP